MALTWVDWAIAAVIFFSSFISLRRGFFKEVLSLLSWFAAGAVTWIFGGAMSHVLAAYISTPSIRIIAACAILFVATLLVGAVLNAVVAELIKITGMSETEHFLGMLFGAARGYLLVVVLVGLMSLAPVEQDEWWRQSRFIPHFLVMADWSKELILRWCSQGFDFNFKFDRPPGLAG